MRMWCSLNWVELTKLTGDCMTTDELKEYMDAMATDISGRVLALMQVIRVLQSQPSYDHEAFLAMLGTLEAALEDSEEGKKPSMTPGQRVSFDTTLNFFSSRLPPLPEAWIARSPKPESAA